LPFNNLSNSIFNNIIIISNYEPIAVDGNIWFNSGSKDQTVQEIVVFYKPLLYEVGVWVDTTLELMAGESFLAPPRLMPCQRFVFVLKQQETSLLKSL